MAVYKLKNKIQNYAWGSTSSMPDLFGFSNPENTPMAELWMGAHPKSPSVVIERGGREIPLDKFIEKNPEEILGAEVCSGFGGRLPFLFKVLAAGSPLSIQAHPNLEQAAEGFQRENEAGIAFDAFNRNYKDDNHKPEIICALTEYHAMRGFRKSADIAAGFRKIIIPELEKAVQILDSEPGDAALGKFFTELMHLEVNQKSLLVENALNACGKGIFSGVEERWIKRFSDLYPEDIGIVSPLYLNVVTLHPGEAMYLPAGVLHAYLEGTGMELMANSDNVLRGGLTPKHIDVPELMKTLNFVSDDPEILNPEKITEYEYEYRTPAAEFCLTRIELNEDVYKLPVDNYGPRLPSIFFCREGSAEVSGENGAVSIKPGEAVLAVSDDSLELSGRAILFRASVPAAE